MVTSIFVRIKTPFKSLIIIHITTLLILTYSNLCNQKKYLLLRKEDISHTTDDVTIIPLKNFKCLMMLHLFFCRKALPQYHCCYHFSLLEANYFYHIQLTFTRLLLPFLLYQNPLLQVGGGLR